MFGVLAKFKFGQCHSAIQKYLLGSIRPIHSSPCATYTLLLSTALSVGVAAFQEWIN